jgi:ribonucleoside-diphosphate reductase beta chain
MSEVSAPHDVHLHDPQTLYQHWEAQQWNPFAVDLLRDGDDWARMSAADRALVLWALSSLMVAEERIATKFSGLVMAYGSEEEESFLTTQQVDEVRHMQFYKRFRDEVIADRQTIAAHVARSREQLGPAFQTIFDEALVQAHERLAASPRDQEAKVRFVVTYHVVIEATLGLTAFEFITRYLNGQQLLPGFVEGYSLIHHDEQRHIGYGTWFLREAIRADAKLADSVRETIAALLPAVAESLTPPDRERADWEALGTSAQEVRTFALHGLSRRLTIIGAPLGDTA